MIPCLRKCRIRHSRPHRAIRSKLVGMGFIIEKAFQNGRKILEEKGVRVESLAIIEDLSNCCIKIKDQ